MERNTGRSKKIGRFWWYKMELEVSSSSLFSISDRYEWGCLFVDISLDPGILIERRMKYSSRRLIGVVLYFFFFFFFFTSFTYSLLSLFSLFCPSFLCYLPLKKGKSTLELNLFLAIGRRTGSTLSFRTLSFPSFFILLVRFNVECIVLLFSMWDSWGICFVTSMKKRLRFFFSFLYIVSLIWVKRQKIKE